MYKFLSEVLKKSKIVETQRNLSEPLDIKLSSKYKSGFKKHRNDQRVAEPLKDLITNYLRYNRIPPIEFNDHALKHGKLKGLRTAHIKGQQIVLLYKISENTLELLGLGSHTDIGTM